MGEELLQCSGTSVAGGAAAQDEATRAAQDEAARRVGETNQAELAKAYLKGVTSHKEGSKSAWAQAAHDGEALLNASGSVEAAARALWDARRTVGLDNLRGVHSADLEGKMDSTLLGYLRDVEVNGAPARSSEERTRTEAKPHQSALACLDQTLKQVRKDVHKARVLVIPTRCEPLLAGVHSSSFGAVEKLNPERSVSTDNRVVHDQRGVNAHVRLEDHPPASQPKHRQLARKGLYWASRCLGIPVMVAKQDIEGAFRLVWLAPQDVPLFAGELPWAPEAMAPTDGSEGATHAGEYPEGIVALYLVLSFGFNGAPGEWMAWATAAQQFHSAHRPEQADRDGPERFQGSILMDDMVLVGPLLGLRPWVSASAYECGTKALLGPQSINAEKNALEGAFSPWQTCWGLEFDFTTMPRGSPSVKFKARALRTKIKAPSVIFLLNT